MSTPQVRLAKAADVNEIIGLVRAFHEEEKPFPLEFSEDVVFSLLLRAMRGDSVAGVIANEDEIESSCYVNIATPWYSSQSVVETLYSYTLPDYRKSCNSKVLLSWEKQQAQRLNCPLQISIPMTENNGPRLALCERVFGPRSGVSFYYHPDQDNPTLLSGPKVIPANMDDLPEIVEVARELGQENGVHSINEDISLNMIRDVIAGDGLIGIVRPDEDGEIAGTILLKIAYPWLSKQPFLDEYWIFCRSKYRKSDIARSLIQFAKHQADKLNLLLRVGIISKIELARKLALYERLLGAPQVCHHTYYPQ